jgi:hypothetical protein
LDNDISRVSYLCSPNPFVIAHSQDPANADAENNLAVERFIERVILKKHPHTKENREAVLAELIDTFWKERDDFVYRRGAFARSHIWVSAANDETMSHEWHKRYSLPHTKVFGDVACVSTPTSLGMGQAERIWKIVKANKKGNRSKMSPDKSKKQAIISAAYSHKKNEARRKAAQRAGVLWTDEDFKFCKLDKYLAAPVDQLLRQRIFRVFKAYREPWEKVQFGPKGDDIHEAMVSAKYGGLKYKDADVGGRVGTFLMNNCTQLTKCMKSGPRKTQEQKAGKGRGYFYTVMGVYDGYKQGLIHEKQDEMTYDLWERDWTFYEMIVDYYKEHPDPEIQIVEAPKEGEQEDEIEGSESDSD